MTTDTQILWDAEAAQHTRKLLKQLAAKVRQCQEKESRYKEEARRTRKDSRIAHDKLTTFIEVDSDKDDLEYVRHLQAVTAAAESAREEEIAARQRWVAAVVGRRKASDELRVAVRRHMQPLPLFDQPPGANDHEDRTPAKPQRRRKEANGD